MDPERWPQQRRALEQVFKSRTRDEWCALMEGTDVCFAPVLSFLEAPSHAHNRSRQTYIDVDGMTQPAPAPRFSRTSTGVAFGARRLGQDTEAVLADWGIASGQSAPRDHDP